MLRRFLQDDLFECLGSFPAVLLTGARQVGKTTLSQQLVDTSWKARYITLDDRATLDAALRDPDGFIDAVPTPAVLDEVQRAPDLLRAVKRVIDRKREPGMYLLTGSADLMTLTTVSETLAGRIALKTLQPFCWPESIGAPLPRLLSALFAETDPMKSIVALKGGDTSVVSRDAMARTILVGGYPPVVSMKSRKARSEWFGSYLQTYVERDLRELRAIEHIPEFNRLLTLAASRTGGLLNMSDLSRETGLPFTTLRRYLNLLEVTYQVRLLQPYHANVSKRLVRTPKLYFLDTGMASFLRVAEDWTTLERQGGAGSMAETWVASELWKILPLLDNRCRLYFWRTSRGGEVDFLVERGGDLVGIEVKWGERIGDSDVRNLRSCEADLEGRLKFSIILYGGEQVVPLAPRIAAVPFPVFFDAKGALP